MDHLRPGFVLGCALLATIAGCSPSAPVADPAAEANPVPVVPAPMLPTAPEPQKPRAARPLVYSSPLDIDGNASFADFNQRFAKARKEQKTLPSGHSELDALYQLVISRGFQGATDGQEINQKLHQWVNADTADPTPMIAQARAALEAAYLARGADYAGIVGDKRRQRFELMLTSAHDLARQALAKGGSDAELYRILLATGHELHAQPGEMVEWMAAGQQLQPNYYPLYDIIAQISAEQNGTRTAELVYMAEKLLRNRKDTDGAELYARIALAANQASPQALIRSGFRLEAVRTGANALHTRYRDSALLLDFLGVVALLTDDFALGQEILPELESRSIDLKHWQSESRYNLFKQRLKAQPPAEDPEFLIWPGLSGGISLAFVDHGKYLLTTDNHYDSIALAAWKMDQLESPPLLIPANQRWGRHLDTDREGIHLLSWYPSQSVMFARVYDFSGQGFPAGFPLPHEIEATFPPPDISLSGGRRGYELGHMELSGNGQRVVAICQSSVKIFGLKENRLLKQFLVPDMRNLARGSRHLSPDGQLLALQTSNGDVQVWDIDAGQVKHHVTDRELKSHYVLAFIEAQSPDRFLLQVSRKTNQQADIYLAHWNPESAALETLATIDRRLTPIASLGSDYVAFSTNAGSQNQEVAVYRTKDGKCLRRIHGHSQKVAQAALSQDAKWLATMEQSGPVKLWKISDQ